MAKQTVVSRRLLPINELPFRVWNQCFGTALGGNDVYSNQVLSSLLGYKPARLSHQYKINNNGEAESVWC